MECAVQLIYRITPDDLFHGSRIRKVSDIRHMAYHILRHDAKCSYPEMARLTNKNHATIIHSCSVTDACMRYADFAEQYNQLRLTFLEIMDSEKLLELVSRYVAAFDCERTKDSRYDKFRDDTVPYASLLGIRQLLLTDKDRKLIQEAQDIPDQNYDLVEDLIDKAETTSGVYFLIEMQKEKFLREDCRCDG